jgi:hypothetical protein
MVGAVYLRRMCKRSGYASQIFEVSQTSDHFFAVIIPSGFAKAAI